MLNVVGIGQHILLMKFLTRLDLLRQFWYNKYTKIRIIWKWKVLNQKSWH